MSSKNQNRVEIANRSDLFDDEGSASGEEFDEVGQNQLDQLMKMSLFQLEGSEPEQAAENEIGEVEVEAKAGSEVEVEQENSPLTFRLFSNLPAQVISTKTQEVINPIQKRTIEDYAYKPTQEELEKFSQVSLSYSQIIEESNQKWETKEYPKRVIKINLKEVNTPIKKSKGRPTKEIDLNLPSPYLVKKLFKPEFKARKVNRVHLRF